MSQEAASQQRADSIRSQAERAGQHDPINQRLFQLSIRPRPLHSHPQVLLPTHYAPISAQMLFRPGERRRVLELGCGWGEFLAEWIRRHPQDDYIAFEIKESRIRSSLSKVRQIEAGQTQAEQMEATPSGALGAPDHLDHLAPAAPVAPAEPLGIHRVYSVPSVHSIHLRIIPINFNWFLEEILPAASFDLIIINFPDPWPKRRHRKHRLVRSGFNDKAVRLLRAGGALCLATDHGPYARQILALMRQDRRFEALYPYPHFISHRPVDMPPTRFEAMHLRANRRLYYQRWRLA